ncbi:MAG: FG-GAP-like repeat-containing protein, partial [Limisphaerales bacterium]
PHRASNVGGTVTFDVQATGMPPLLYQWRHNGTNLAGATRSQLTLNNIQSAQQGNYSVEVSNLAGSLVSSNAQLGLFTCVFQTAASQTNFLLEGGSGSISVLTSNGCSWAATTTNEWITITAGTPGNGNGTAHFTIAENLGANRSGSIVVAGKNHVITQAGANLPSTFAGRTFTLIPDPGSGISQRFVLVIAHDGSGIRLYPANQTNLLDSASFDYTLLPGGVARITFGSSQLDFSFAAGASGSFTASNLAGNSYQGTFAMLESGPDFNGDGRGDLLIRTDYRSLVAWMMNGTNFLRNGAIRNGVAVGTDWRAAGIADFNGDGKADILFQDTTGRHAVWTMDGTEFKGSYFLKNGSSVGVGWASVGIADFDGNGSKDILFQRQDGALAVWLLDGTNFIRSAWLRDGLPATGWRCFGTGDFNGDGKPDVLFQQSSTGRLAVWYFHGTSFLRGDLLRDGISVPAIWRPAAVADINEDGKPDIIFQNTDGVLAAWLMNGKDFIGSVLLRNGQPAGAGGRLIAPK